MLMKELRIDPDDVWNSNNNYKMHNINDLLNIDQHFEYLQKHFEPKVIQGDNVLQIISGSPGSTKIPKNLGLS